MPIIIIFCRFLLLVLALMSHRQLTGQSLQSLKDDFVNPPVSAFPKTYYWWLNGHVDTVRIKNEIRAMHDAGLSGFDIFDVGMPAHDTVVKAGAPFLGDESLQAIRVALKLAKKLGMTAGLSMASSWNAGGSWVQPEQAAKSIYFSKTAWKGGKAQKLDFPELEHANHQDRVKNIALGNDGRPMYYEEIAVLAIPSSVTSTYVDTGDILNLTPYFDPEAEILDWQGKGDYQIFRYICSNSGEQLKLPGKFSTGLIIDHFDAEATRAHFYYVIDKMNSILPEGIDQSALKSLYLASYEATGFTWTPTLPEVFHALNGYDIYPLIPALFDPELFAPDIVASFDRDFRRTLSELMINNFYGEAKRICHANGLKINSESGGPGFPLHNVPVEPLKSLGVMDLPRGEFWINHSRLNADGIDILRVVKEVSAASHIYGRRMVEEEAFTTFQHWQEGPFEMKPSGDRAFCEGMNKVVVHGWSHNPQGYDMPGIVYHAGTHFNDRRIWWPMVRPFTEYLARISFLAQECDFMADVLYYYGDAIPNYAGHKNSRFMVGPGYDYEVVNTEVLKRLSVRDGLMELPTGAQFKILVLEPEEEMHPEVFQKIRELVAAGGVILGERPQSISARKNLPELIYSNADIDALWQTLPPGGHAGDLQGKVWMGVGPAEVMEQLETPPDFTYVDEAFFKLDYIHYRNDETDFYFIRNTTNQWINRVCKFRQVGKEAELWNPQNGAIEAAILAEQKGPYHEVPLSLAPFGSVIVAFSDPDQGEPKENISFVDDFQIPVHRINNGELLIWEEGPVHLNINGNTKPQVNFVREQKLEGAWEVTFPSGWGAPKLQIFDDLFSWTDSEVAGIKYFSGTATYHKTFHYDIQTISVIGNRIYLDLGDLTNVARAWLNDTLLGVVWTPPYQFDVTDILKPGDNILRIEVANTWNNRLKGDAIAGTSFTQTNITHTNVAGLNKTRLPWREVPLIRAGLFGPVKLITLKPIPLELRNRN